MIPDYDVDSAVQDKKVEICYYRSYTALEILEALKQLIPSKHCLVLDTSFGGTPVPISSMCGEALISAAGQKFKLEAAPIISWEFVEWFKCQNCCKFYKIIWFLPRFCCELSYFSYWKQEMCLL